MNEHQSEPEQKRTIELLRSTKRRHIFEVDLSGGVVVSINDFKENLEELAELKEAIILEIQSMERQITAAKKRAFEQNIYADSRWFTAVKRNIQIKRSQLQIIDARSKELRRNRISDQEFQHAEFCKKFYKSARAVISKPIMDLIESHVSASE